MTENDVINELQAASEWYKEHGRNTNTAIVGICERAIDFIKCQSAEYEQLKHKYDLAVAEREANVKGFTEQIETLTKENEVLKTNNHSMCLSMPNIAKAERAAAVKEFAERLKATMEDFARMDFRGSTYFCVGLHHLDNLVKEFTEGE